MRTTLAAIATVIIALAAPATAQDAYPSKPVRFIVPFPPTGPLDVMARLYAQKLGERWGKSVIAENRPGATGTIGADAVAKAAPDGYTLLFTVDLPIVMAPALMKPPYDSKTDLLPIAAVGDTMNMLVVHPSAGVSTLPELVAAAKAKPGALTFSSAGNASPGHLCVEMLKSAAGVDLTHVPYKGAAPAMQAALAGEVSMFCGPITQGLPHVKSGKLRALGVTGAKASPLLPELKPLAATYPGLVVSNWYAVFAPPKTPPAVVTFLRAELKRTYDDPEVRKRLDAVGMDPLWMEPAQVTAAIDRDLAKWSGVVKAANIKAE
jgi:tripartite-type tricarboxylate transporter receptor subunit TctC